MKALMLMERAARLRDFDNQIREESPGYVIIGVDEAGRGPLAGPVVAAAVAFDEYTGIDCVFDSKRMSEKQREHAYKMIVDESIAFAVAFASADEIDAMNIRQASLLAMRRAVSMMEVPTPLVLVDGKDALGHNLYSRAIVGGDGLSLSIAAASVLAKVTRDGYMRLLDVQFPGYGFAVNKGYPTAGHFEALRRMGPCRYHRLSYRGVLPNAEDN